MDTAAAQQLTELTSAFYREVAPSFDETRRSGWPGWERMLEVVGVGPGDASGLRVLDLACGNMRFERFLAQRGVAFEAWAYDNCDELAALGEDGLEHVTYANVDVLAELFAGHDLARVLASFRCDLAVSFGFLHHVALPRHRQQVLEALVDSVRPGGYVALSLWQFSRSARIMAKAEPVTGGGEGDYLLGWQGRTDVQRYCHSFSEGEIDALAASVASRTREVARFSADGRTADLNRYLVLQVR